MKGKKECKKERIEAEGGEIIIHDKKRSRQLPCMSMLTDQATPPLLLMHKFKNVLTLSISLNLNIVQAFL